VKHLALITSDYHMQYSFMLFSARAQLQYGGKMDMVGAACYNTGNYSGYSYQTQAEAVAAIAGVSISKMSKPTLSKVTDLTVLGLSLTYIPLSRLWYSLLTVILSGQIVGWIQHIPLPDGGKKEQSDGNHPRQ
jgi:hypothetical protein